MNRPIQRVNPHNRFMMCRQDAEEKLREEWESSGNVAKSMYAEGAVVRLRFTIPEIRTAKVPVMRCETLAMERMLRRVCRSTLSAEAQSLCNSLEGADYLKVLLSEFRGLHQVIPSY